MDKKFLIAGACFGLIGVITGAFATHGLQPILTEASMKSFETAVKYQMYHALLLLLLGAKILLTPKLRDVIFYLFIFGIIFFSGSIYLLATNNLTEIDFKSIALVTPFGGSLLILGWILMLVSVLKLKKEDLRQ
ncbi:DUF423 domain-containing protein [Salegentibacter sp. F188]|uniref:DUF423 domain-containing protein n=1 Tax=Autumnicola patrickiae TaxID=3075591 RepID=A0ABU3E674_9FLAO|nr:DUF423 domain-containing protein [Salegentibacter sp. F188]MDT0690717.1 DUF423 domain-containing protein [Salegentibacter sp. F188]